MPPCCQVVIVLKLVDPAKHLLDAQLLNVSLAEEIATGWEEIVLFVRCMLRSGLTKVLEGRLQCQTVFRVQGPAALLVRDRLRFRSSRA